MKILIAGGVIFVAAVVVVIVYAAMCVASDADDQVENIFLTNRYEHFNNNGGINSGTNTGK